jgi:L-threonylcarbamoyladenylate synthase
MKRWRVDGDPPADVIAAIAAVLLDGGVALLPTDTIYGLHAVATNDAAIARIAEIKGRGDDKPFVVIAGSVAQIRALGADVPKALAEIWPAPLTAILPRGSTTIAARIPDVEWLRRLMERTGPLVSTSANRSGEPPISSPNDLARPLQTQLDAVLDAGRCEGKASTIVDFTGHEPRLVREGDIRFTQNLRKTLRISL